MTEPTDAELIAELEAAGVSFLAFLGGMSGAKKVWTTSGSQDAKKIAAGMRAAIAKWGTPPAVAGEPVAWRQGSLTTVNQDPYPSLGDWFVQFWEGDDVAARVYGNDMETLRRRCAVIATPQPTQAQAGAVPLTDEEVLDAFCRTAGIYQFVQAFRAGVRFAEQHHGIKGGQHGAE